MATTNITSIMSNGLQDIYKTATTFADQVMNPKYAKIGTYFASIETNYADPLGKVPVFSLFSGAGRSAAGELVATYFLATGFFRAIGSFFIGGKTGAKLWAQAKIDLFFVKQGVGNMIRGWFETASSVNFLWMVTIKPILICYDSRYKKENQGYLSESEVENRLSSFQIEGGDDISVSKLAIIDKACVIGAKIEQQFNRWFEAYSNRTNDEHPTRDSQYYCETESGSNYNNTIINDNYQQQ